MAKRKIHLANIKLECVREEVSLVINLPKKSLFFQFTFLYHGHIILLYIVVIIDRIVMSMVGRTSSF